jgi:hypothetical protein
MNREAGTVPRAPDADRRLTQMTLQRFSHMARFGKGAGVRNGAEAIFRVEINFAMRVCAAWVASSGPASTKWYPSRRTCSRSNSSICWPIASLTRPDVELGNCPIRNDCHRIGADEHALKPTDIGARLPSSIANGGLTLLGSIRRSCRRGPSQGGNRNRSIQPSAVVSGLRDSEDWSNPRPGPG